MDDLRALHSRILGRKPVVADLPDTLQYVANASSKDEEDPALRWFRDKLSSDDWDRIEAARDEEKRREKEKAEAAALCRRGDEAGLRSMYPGHASITTWLCRRRRSRSVRWNSPACRRLAADSWPRRSGASINAAMPCCYGTSRKTSSVTGVSSSTG